MTEALEQPKSQEVVLSAAGTNKAEKTPVKNG